RFSATVSPPCFSLIMWSTSPPKNISSWAIKQYSHNPFARATTKRRKSALMYDIDIRITPAKLVAAPALWLIASRVRYAKNDLVRRIPGAKSGFFLGDVSDPPLWFWFPPKDERR